RDDKAQDDNQAKDAPATYFLIHNSPFRKLTLSLGNI
ncbi:MAG: hypothetical protein RL683_123, partial [Actinomycetota bacterium]